MSAALALALIFALARRTALALPLHFARSALHALAPALGTSAQRQATLKATLVTFTPHRHAPRGRQVTNTHVHAKPAPTRLAEAIRHTPTVEHGVKRRETNTGRKGTVDDK